MNSAAPKPKPRIAADRGAVGTSCLPPELIIGSAQKRFSVEMCSADERVITEPILASDGEAAMKQGLKLLDSRIWWEHRQVLSVRVSLIRD